MFRLWRFTGGTEKFSLGVNPARDELEDVENVCAVPPARRDFQPVRGGVRRRQDRTAQASSRDAEGARRVAKDSRQPRSVARRTREAQTDHRRTALRSARRQSMQVMRRLIALLLLLGAAHLGAEPLRI